MYVYVMHAYVSLSNVHIYNEDNDLQFDMQFYVYVNSQEDVAKEFGIPVQCQRFWLWAKRQNHTYRPNRALTPQEETQSVSAFYLVYLHFGLSTLVVRLT